MMRCAHLPCSDLSLAAAIGDRMALGRRLCAFICVLSLYSFRAGSDQRNCIVLLHMVMAAAPPTCSICVRTVIEDGIQVLSCMPIYFVLSPMSGSPPSNVPLIAALRCGSKASGGLTRMVLFEFSLSQKSGTCFVWRRHLRLWPV